MGYLLIRQPQLKNISLSENKYSYRLYYNLSYTNLSGITLRLHNVDIINNSKDYLITINNKNDIKLLREIDNYLNKLTKCKSILKGNTINLMKNSLVNKLIKQYESYIDIHIITVKKNAYQSYPIVYLL